MSANVYVGSRVMATCDLPYGVYRGQIGVVTHITFWAGALTVNFGGASIADLYIGRQVTPA